MQKGDEAISISSTQAFIGVDAMVGLSNVYPTEDKSKRPIRWTGPGSVFSLYLPIDRHYGWSTDLICLDSVSPFNWDNIFVECEEDMSLCRHRHVGGQHHVSFDIKPVRNMTGAILRFHLQETRRMRPPLFGEVDQRILGLCVESLKLQKI